MSMNMQDPYRTLGVKRTASTDDIKTSYRRLARELHPDRKPGDKRAEERFKDISSAYHLLSDPAKRRKFDAGEIDAMGNRRPGFNGGFGGGFGDSAAGGYDAYRRHGNAGPRPKKSSKNPFNSFFKDRPGKTQSIKAKGADVQYTLKVSLMDAAQGAEKTVRMTSGKTLKVRIPPGTETGQTLRLKAQGMAGLGGGVSGDALVEILVENDAQFRTEGLDVYSEEPVTLAEALLGGRIEVRTIHGPVLVTVPEGSNTGTKLRLKAKGVHKSGTTTRGDHYVSLKVVLPDGDDVDLKKFVKKWSSKHPYTVRKETLKRTAAE